MRNVGAKSWVWLKRAGIHSDEELREAGAVTAYVRVSDVLGRRPSLNLLHAIAAGLEDRDWRELTPEEKGRLEREVSDIMDAERS